jgi:hypothetical protein
MTDRLTPSATRELLPVELDEAQIEKLRETLVGCAHDGRDRDILNSLCDLAIASLGLVQRAVTLRVLLDRDITFDGRNAVLPFESHDQAINHIAEARRKAG